MATKQKLEHKVEFIANPTQHAFITSQKEADLFSCRMGEGKTAALAWSAFHHTQHNPGAMWLLIRDTWENCRDTTRAEFFQWFPPGVMGEYTSSTKTFVWKVEGLEGSVSFIGLDEEKDARKLQSRPLGGFGIDEPAPAAQSGGIAEMIFDTALSRLRQPDMKWYAAKLAENSPDESHWTYSRFVDPGDPNFGFFKAEEPENLAHLPPDYYDKIRKNWIKRPDLVHRFADGRFGFQKLGKDVTPEWSEPIHLSDHLDPVRGKPLVLCWDFGLNPTCLITQITPLGHWHILEAHVGEEIGLSQHIDMAVIPRLTTRFHGYTWSHIGDPAGRQREQSDSRNSAVRILKTKLGGVWRDGPPDLDSGVDALRNVMRTHRNGTGMLRVDKDLARPVWHALRGGWHRKVNPAGVVMGDPVKNLHSHPGDALRYGAGKLFPITKLQNAPVSHIQPGQASYFRRALRGQPGLRMPRHGEKMSFTQVWNEGR